MAIQVLRFWEHFWTDANDDEDVAEVECSRVSAKRRLRHWFRSASKTFPHSHSLSPSLFLSVYLSCSHSAPSQVQIRIKDIDPELVAAAWRLRLINHPKRRSCIAMLLHGPLYPLASTPLPLPLLLPMRTVSLSFWQLSKIRTFFIWQQGTHLKSPKASLAPAPGPAPWPSPLSCGFVM